MLIAGYSLLAVLQIRVEIIPARIRVAQFFYSNADPDPGGISLCGSGTLNIVPDSSVPVPGQCSGGGSTSELIFYDFVLNLRIKFNLTQ